MGGANPGDGGSFFDGMKPVVKPVPRPKAGQYISPDSIPATRPLPEPEIIWFQNKFARTLCAMDHGYYIKPISADQMIHLVGNNRLIVIMVASIDGQPVGYVCYELHTTKLILVHLVVDEPFRGMGVGTALMDFLKTKIDSRRPLLATITDERDDEGLQFLRACGPSWCRLSRGGISRDDEIDSVGFGWRLKDAKEVPPKG